jgi:hypothetical protein
LPAASTRTSVCSLKGRATVRSRPHRPDLGTAVVREEQRAVVVGRGD